MSCISLWFYFISGVYCYYYKFDLIFITIEPMGFKDWSKTMNYCIFKTLQVADVSKEFIIMLCKIQFFQRHNNFEESMLLVSSGVFLYSI